MQFNTNKMLIENMGALQRKCFLPCSHLPEALVFFVSIHGLFLCSSAINWDPIHWGLSLKAHVEIWLAKMVVLVARISLKMHSVRSSSFCVSSKLFLILMCTHSCPVLLCHWIVQLPDKVTRYPSGECYSPSYLLIH